MRYVPGTIHMTRTVVVTGGSSGIGRATCNRYAEAGYRVVIADVQQEPREGGMPTAERIQTGDGDAAFIETDVTEWDSVQALVDAVIDRYGCIDVLVNNAGVAERAPIDELAVEDAHRIFRINVDGVFHGMKAVIPHMRGRGAGSIVNVASGAGKAGMADLSAYCGSKFAVIGMTESVAKEVESDGITVNAVCPGRTATAMTDFEGDDPAHVADVIYETGQAGYTGRAVDVQ